MHNEPSATGGHGTPLPLNRVYILSYQSTPIRFALIDGQPWFVAVDVCRAVGVLNPRYGGSKHIRAVPSDQKMTARLANASREALTVHMVSVDGLDKLLWLALHSVSKAWSVLSSITAQVSVVFSRGASNVC
ncbi:hypothetical protein ACU8LZ_22315 [Rhizobium leguminosarum]